LLERLSDRAFLRIERKITDVELDVFATGRVETSTTTGTSRSTDTATLGARFVDTDRASVNLSLVHLANGGLGGFTGCERDKTESTGALGTAVHWEKDFRDGTELRKLFAELVFIRSVIQIAYVELDAFRVGAIVRRSTVIRRSGGICMRRVGGAGTFTISHGFEREG
jgi:hypothetical protein